MTGAALREVRWPAQVGVADSVEDEPVWRKGRREIEIVGHSNRSRENAIVKERGGRNVAAT